MAIELKGVTKDFGNGRGIFDVSFDVRDGETVGFLGPNGAGKSTTIRILMGFLKTNSGSATIFNKDTFKDREEIQKRVGYLPGETNFPTYLSVSELIKLTGELRRAERDDSAELLERFSLDSKTKIKTMSLGEKRKLGIVIAFMNDPDVLILDEPTNGLDPLNQRTFFELMEEKKKCGKTILTSSHRIDEVESSCDRVVMLKDGKVVADKGVCDIKNAAYTTYVLRLNGYENGALNSFAPEKLGDGAIKVKVKNGEINSFIKCVSGLDVASLKEEEETLDSYFMRFYEGGRKND